MTFTNPGAAAASGDFSMTAVKKLLVSGSVVAAIVFYGYELLEKNPQRGFDLLLQFGPSFLISVFVLIIVWDLLGRGVGYVGKLADSMDRLSSAVDRIAEKDDRQFEEMRRLSQFAAQTAERSFQILSTQSDVLERIERTLAQRAN